MRNARGSLRQRQGLSGRGHRRAREDGAGRFLLRRAHRRSASGCFTNPDFDENARRRWDSDRSITIPSTTPIAISSGRTALACRARSVMSARTRSSARRSGEAEMGEPERASSAPSIFWWDRVFNWRGRPTRTAFLSGAARLASWHARHVARLDRQHQQSADDECHLPARAANGPGEEVGQGEDDRRRTGQQTVQRLTFRRAMRWRSSSCRRTPPGRRAC